MWSSDAVSFFCFEMYLSLLKATIVICLDVKMSKLLFGVILANAMVMFDSYILDPLSLIIYEINNCLLYLKITITLVFSFSACFTIKIVGMCENSNKGECGYPSE